MLISLFGQLLCKMGKHSWVHRGSVIAGLTVKRHYSCSRCGKDLNLEQFRHW